MKRQAIAICLNDLKKLEKEIKKELKYLDSLPFKASIIKKGNIGVLMSIINYPTIVGKKKFYASDSWEFEGLRRKVRGEKNAQLVRK